MFTLLLCTTIRDSTLGLFALVYLSAINGRFRSNVPISAVLRFYFALRFHSIRKWLNWFVVLGTIKV